MSITEPIRHFPNSLQANDELRVVAPGYSMALLSDEVRGIANERLSEECGLRATYGANAEECNSAASSSIGSRVMDLMAAFADPEVKVIMSAIGGYNSNQLLTNIDWRTISENPKVFCGFSDITALGNAIFKMTGLVTYNGPHYSSFGQKVFDSYTTEYFKKACFKRGEYAIVPSSEWTDDEEWFTDQDARRPQINEGHWVINEGATEGNIVGGNLCTYNLLQGTPYFPDIPNAVAFVEDTKMSNYGLFDRDLQSLLQAQEVAGLVIGRFQRESAIDRDVLTDIIATKPELKHVPVVANVDFGHTFPLATFPIGGGVILVANQESCEIIVRNH